MAYRQKRLGDAEFHLRQALRIDPNDEYGNEFLGSLYLLDRDIPAALKYWNRIDKPLIQDVAITPSPRLNEVLRERSVAISGGQILTLARLRQEPWEQAVRDNLLAPLGMTRTTARPQAPSAAGWGVHPLADLLHVEPEHDAGALAPAGQLWSTATDLARWAAFLGGATGEVLARSTLEEMCRPVAVNDAPGTAWTTAHGLGFQVWNVDGARFAASPLIEQVMVPINEATFDAALPALSGTETFEELIEGGLRAYWAHICEDPAPHQLTYELTQYALRAAPELAQKQYESYLELTGKYLVAIAELSRHTWEVPVETLARYLLAMIEGCTFQLLVDGDQEAGFSVLTSFGRHLARSAHPAAPA